MGFFDDVASFVGGAVQSVAAPVVTAAEDIYHKPLQGIAEAVTAPAQIALNSYANVANSAQDIPIVGDVTKGIDQNLAGGASAASRALTALSKGESPSLDDKKALQKTLGLVAGAAGGGAGISEGLGLSDSFGSLFDQLAKINLGGTKLPDNVSKPLNTYPASKAIQNAPKNNNTLIFVMIAILGGVYYYMRRK